ncbi:uncharacterized protein [Clytia hemisphaerica]|uniref:DNA cross-link repair 1A protein n=1 Tax=Clytia hemisphaerica TaxID=252671 RepID=A0A7M5X961_9CNID
MDDSDEEIQPLKRKKKGSDTPIRTSRGIVKHSKLRAAKDCSTSISVKFKDKSQKFPMSKKEIQLASQHPSSALKSKSEDSAKSSNGVSNNGESSSKSASASPQKTKMKNEVDYSSTKAFFSSSYNKADQVFFKPRNLNNTGSQKTTLCPVCNINLLFLHGVSPQFHINECLDRNPNFEEGYCSGDSSCSLSNVEHFRRHQHVPNIPVKTDDESSCSEQEIIIAEPTKRPVPQTPKEPSLLSNNQSPKSAKKQTSINDFFGGKKKPQTPARKIFQKQNTDTPRVKASKTSNTERKPKNAPKECPFYKKIPGTNFTVDAFRYGDIKGCTCYFLTHFHSDHYGGLKKSFKGKLYCSQITASLVTSQLRVSSACIHVLPMNKTVEVEGVKITLFDANHCPGAVMFLMELPSPSKRILHVGDFRANLQMTEIPLIKSRPIDCLYLDTTYCKPEYSFPPQNDVIEFVVKTARRYLKENPKTLIVCGTYSIGKEKVLQAIANEFDFKVAVTPHKMKILKCLNDTSLNQRLTLDYDEANVHVLAMNKLSIKLLHEHLVEHQQTRKWQRILAFKPTGWTFSGKLTSLDKIEPIIRPDVTIYGVPYSEHSSFEELKSFVSALKPKKILATVGIGNKETRDRMNEYFTEWLKKD